MEVLDKVDLPKLRKLADFLDTVPEEQFDLSCWADYDDYQSAIKLFGFTLRQECGFAGCAVGWAAHVGLFEDFTLGSAHHTPTYQGHLSFAAIDALFGFPVFYHPDTLKTGMSEYLFDISQYNYWNPTPSMVAARIRKLIKKIEGRIARYKSNRLVEEIKATALERVGRPELSPRALLVIEGTCDAKPSC